MTLNDLVQNNSDFMDNGIICKFCGELFEPEVMEDFDCRICPDCLDEIEDEEISEIDSHSSNTCDCIYCTMYQDM